MKITYQLEGKCMWHSDCVEGHGSGIMVSVKKDAGGDLFLCRHCGKRGYYPVGSVGEIEVDELPELLRVCLEMLSLLESLDALGAIQDDVDAPDWKAWGNAISEARHQGK